MSSILGEVYRHKTVCAKCRAEGLGEDVKEGCMGDCPNCGKFIAHGEDHATDCTLEEEMRLLAENPNPG